MNKSVLLTLLIGSVLFSCTKKEASCNPGATNSNYQATVGARFVSNYRILYKDCGGVPGCPDPDFICLDEGGNCLPDVIVHPATGRYGVISTMTDVLSKGPDAISNFFKEKIYSDIFGVPFEPGIQERLVNGTLTVVRLGKGDKYLYAFVNRQFMSDITHGDHLEQIELVIPI